MSAKKYGSSKKQLNELKIDENIMRLILAIFVVIPLIVRIKVSQYVSPVILYSESFNTGLKGDFFDYNKLFVLKIMICLLLGFFIYKMFITKFEIPLRLENILLFLLFLLVLGSLLLSEYPTIAVDGIHDRYEGTTAFLSYFILFFIVSSISYRDNNIKNIFTGLMVFIAINFITSMTHFLGYDLFKYDIIKRLITPLNYGIDIVGPSSFIVTTLANQNYLSGISGAITGIFLYLASVSTEHKDTFKYAVFTLVSFITLLASLSTSGFVTLMVILPIVIIFIVFNKQNKVKSFGLMSALVLTLIFTLFIMGSYNNYVWEETVGVFNGILTAPNSVVQQIPETESIMKQEFNIPKRGIGPLSGRLYLWQETIKLILEKPIIGHGLDTIFYYFPNNGFSIYANIGSDHAVATKPHNFYLNFAFGVGLIAMLLLLMLISIVLFKSLMIIFKGTADKITKINLSALIIGILAILFQWIFNDSVTGVGVMFWIMLGICSSIYYSSTRTA